MGFSLKKIGKKLGSGFKSVAKKVAPKITKGLSKVLNNKFTQKVVGKIPIIGKAVKVGGAAASLADKELAYSLKGKRKATTVVKPSVLKASQQLDQPERSISKSSTIDEIDSIWNDAKDINKQTMFDKLKVWYDNNKTLAWALGIGLIVVGVLAYRYFKNRR